MTLPNDLTSRFDGELWICPIQYGIVCKGGGGSAPPSVDPVALANAQTASNIQTATTQSKLNNVNTYSPLGSSTFSFDPSSGQYSLNQNLTPGQVDTFNSQFGDILNVLGKVPTYTGAGENAIASANKVGLSASPFFNPNVSPVQQTVAGAGPIQRSVATDFPAQVQAAQNAAYRGQAQYLDPQFAQARSDLAQQLADQGIGVNTDAYTRATGNLGRQQQQAYQGASDAAVAAGNEEQARLFGEALGAGQFSNQGQQQQFGQNLTGAQFGNQAQGQQYGENLQTYQAPFSTAAMLTGIGTQDFGAGLSALSAPSTQGWAGQIPTFGGSPTVVSPSNVVGAQQVATNADAARFNAQNTLNNQFFNGLGSLGSVLGGTSGLFGGGGLLGGLFGGAGGAATQSAGLFGGLGSLFGGGAGLSEVGPALPFFF